MVNQPPKSILRKSPNQPNGLFGFISQEQILDDIMMIARRHDEVEKCRVAEQNRIAERRAARERSLAEQFQRNFDVIS